MYNVYFDVYLYHLSQVISQTIWSPYSKFSLISFSHTKINKSNQIQFNNPLKSHNLTLTVT